MRKVKYKTRNDCRIYNSGHFHVNVVVHFYVVFLSGCESVQGFLSFVFICIGDPIISRGKDGELRFH